MRLTGPVTAIDTGAHQWSAPEVISGCALLPLARLILFVWRPALPFPTQWGTESLHPTCMPSGWLPGWRGIALTCCFRRTGVISSMPLIMQGSQISRWAFSSMGDSSCIRGLRFHVALVTPLGLVAHFVSHRARPRPPHHLRTDPPVYRPARGMTASVVISFLIRGSPWSYRITRRGHWKVALVRGP